MLALLEKVTWGLTALAIAVFGAAYFFLGGPSTVPKIEARAETRTIEEYKSTLTPAQKERVDELMAPKPTGKSKNGKPPRRPKRSNAQLRAVNRATLDRVKSFNTAVKEARKIRSKVVDYEGGTGLQIEGVGRDESTLFGKLGFQEKDVLLGLDGERLDFDSLSGAASMIPGSEANQLYDRFKEQLESGAPIAVDVVRNGRPMQIFFALDDRL